MSTWENDCCKKRRLEHLFNAMPPGVIIMSNMTTSPDLLYCTAYMVKWHDFSNTSHVCLVYIFMSVGSLMSGTRRSQILTNKATVARCAVRRGTRMCDTRRSGRQLPWSHVSTINMQINADDNPSLRATCQLCHQTSARLTREEQTDFVTGQG